MNSTFGESILRWSLAYGLLASLLGCGGSSSPGLVKVSGSVRLVGNPIPPGTVTFVSASDKGNSASATIDAEGKYVLGTFEKGDGALPGDYIVRIESYEIPPTMGGPPAKPGVPQRYFDIKKSNLKFTIKEAPNQVIDIDLTK